VAKTCIFCGGPGPFTKEHIIPEWAAKLLRVRRVRVTPRRLGVADKPWESVGSFGATVSRVCKKRCNNGWMSDLEKLAQPILRQMIIPRRPVRLSADERVIVACWLWKLAIVSEFPTGAVYFNESERTCLMDGNGPPEIGVRMWIASYGGEMDANLRGGPCTFSSPAGRKLQGFAQSMNLRRFAAQLVCVRVPPEKRVNLKSHFDFTDAELAVWPEGDDAIKWPPSAGLLNDRDFDKWHTRWDSELPVER
jgi:hypothetical protein